MTIKKLKLSWRSRFWWYLRKWYYTHYMSTDFKYHKSMLRDAAKAIVADKKQKEKQAKRAIAEFMVCARKFEYGRDRQIKESNEQPVTEKELIDWDCPKCKAHYRLPEVQWKQLYYCPGTNCTCIVLRKRNEQKETKQEETA